ncbi:ribosomal protein S18-alanine N-acetyltransferase [Falsiphaeobacter marinintestinus]|uniref:ribosomal protein S18-alanine N-acetyltransferase n=1 Tax=Falsiphaeobacter marinintestinus TaxID=1492905 RepID=UPI001FE33D9B|nr:ribosomal protein S18-alanine N-acetyltransferase [Phaeobacter marinintestinus]
MTPHDMAATHAATFTHSRPWTEAEFAAFLNDPTCFVVGDARAFALVRVILDTAELLTIATHPDHQRQGLARVVMRDWQAKAHAKGAEQAFLEVATDNTAAIALYEACGFAHSGTRRGYYRREHGPAVDAIVMACPLPSRQVT